MADIFDSIDIEEPAATPAAPAETQSGGDIFDTVDNDPAWDKAAAEQHEQDMSVSLWQRIKNARKSGQLDAELGLLRAQQIYGNETPEIEARIREIKAQRGGLEDPVRKERGWIDRAITGAANMTPIMESGMRTGVERGLATGAAAGLAAAAGGQMGPQIAAPEELVTVPVSAGVAFGVGMTHGTMQNIGEIEAGLAYDEMTELVDEAGNRIDPTTAKSFAAAVGVINAALEGAQISTLVKTFPGGKEALNKLIRSVATKKIKEYATKQGVKAAAVATAKGAVEYGKDVAKETGQELLQEATTIVGTELAKKVNNKLKGTDLDAATVDEITGRLKETAVESALSFAALSAPGHTLKTGSKVRQTLKTDTEPAPEVLPPEQQPVTDESRMLPPPTIEVTPEGTAFTPEQKSNIINQGLNVPGMSDEQVAEAQQNINAPPQPDPNRASNLGVIAERGLMVLPHAEPVHNAVPVDGAPQGARNVGPGPVTDPGRMLVNPFGMPAPSVQVSPEGVAMMPEQKSDLINGALGGMPEGEIQKAQERLNAPERLDAMTELRDKIAGNLLKKDGTPKKTAGARALARLFALNEQIAALTPTTTPEAPASMEAQMRALVDGRKPAVLVTPGEAMPSVPEGFQTAKIPEGTLIFSKEGTLNLAKAGKLGSALGYGIDAKPEGSTTVVTARDESGTVIQDVLTDGSEEVVKAAEKAAGDKGTVEVRPVDEAIAEREEGEQEHGVKEPWEMTRNEYDEARVKTVDKDYTFEETDQIESPDGPGLAGEANHGKKAIRRKKGAASGTTTHEIRHQIDRKHEVHQKLSGLFQKINGLRERTKAFVREFTSNGLHHDQSLLEFVESLLDQYFKERDFLASELPEIVDLFDSLGLDQYADLNKSHREIVKQALAEGKSVPTEVLAEHPDLQATVKQETAEKSTTSEAKPEKSPEPVKQAPLQIKAISEKAIVVHGDTKAHKDRLNKNGLKGLWNGKHGGWMFPKAREAEVREALKDLLEAPKSAKELVSEAESMAKQYAAEGKTKDQFVDDAPGRLRWIFENSKGQTVQIGTPIREAFADAGYKRPGNIGEVWDRANGHEKAGTANEPARQSPLKEWADKISADDPAGWVRRYVAEHGTDPTEQAVADKFGLQPGRASKIIEVNGINGLKQLAEVGKPGALEEFSRVFKEKKPAWAKPKMATSVFMGRVTDILERSARLQENARNSDRENFAIAYRKAYGEAVTDVLNESLEEGVDVAEAHAFASNMTGAQLRRYSDSYFELAGGKDILQQPAGPAKPAQTKGVPGGEQQFVTLSETPNGRFVFAGKVPTDLSVAYEKDGSPVSVEDALEIRQSSNPAMVRKAKEIKGLSWDTAEQAREFAASKGYTIRNLEQFREEKKPATASSLDAELADLDMDDLSAMFDEVANEQSTVKESLTADKPAGMTLLEARNMLIELRTQGERQGRVMDDRLLQKIKQAEALVEELEMEESSKKPKHAEWRNEYRRQYAEEGTHFAAGYADFKKGKPRELPTYFATSKGKNPRDWLRGWDTAASDEGAKSQAALKRPATKKPATTKPSDTQTAVKIASEAAKHGVKGVSEAMQGLVDLFGGADSLKSFPSGLDRDTYAEAKPHFQKALEEFRAAGKGVKDFMRFIVQNFSARVKPYLMHFLDEVKNGDMIASAEAHAGKDNIDDRIEETGAAEGGESVRDDREGTAGDGDNAPASVVPEAAQSPDGVEAAAAADAESGREGAQGDQSTDGSGVSTPRSRRGRSSGVHSDKTGGRSDRQDRGRRDLEPQQTTASNYRIPGDFTPGRGEAAKYADNLAAIRILKTLQKEKRLATAEEQQALARYVGWGGLANAFRRPDGSMAKGWESKVEELEGLLTEKELEVARNSTQFAHYTSKDVVDGLWKIAQRLGFKGGNVLEPAMGTGNFLGLVPEELAGATHFTGVEYDPLTAGIAAALYPQSNVIHSGFEKIPLPPNYFDFVIGNPPFSQNSLRFKYTPDFNRFSMHNQFMLAGIEALKPGGVQVFVVSRFFLDAKSGAARAKIAEQADLIAAFRLPDTAFKANAGTEVITDIIVLRKIDDPESRNGVKWQETAEVADPLGGDPITVNEYFKEHPRNIIGTLDRSGTQNMHNDINVHLDPDMFLADELDARIRSLPENIITAQTPQDRARQAFEDLQTSIGIALRGGEIGNVIFNARGELTQVYEKEAAGGGELYAERILTEDSPWHNSLQQNGEGKWYEVVDKLDKKGKPVKVVGPDGKPTKLNQKEERVYESVAEIPDTKKLGKLGYARLKGAVEILDTLIEQINLENTQDATDKEIEANRKKLNRQYREFVKEHDYMNSQKMLRIVDSLPNGALLRSLEAKYKAPITPARAKTLGIKPRDAIVKTADILEKRIVYPYEVPTSADSATDALAVVLSETGLVDIDRIAELTGQTAKQVIDELHTSAETPVVFQDPETGRWETADEYLGGNVVRKLEAAKQAEMDRNIAALEKVQPEPWTADKVTVSIGATWVPGKVYAAFLEHLTGAPGAVTFSRLTNTFSVEGSSDTADAKNWNTPGRNVVDLVGNILNSQAIKVTRTVSDGHGGTHTYVDTEATQAANDMAETIKEEFSEWIFRDSGRRRELVDLFNRKFNVRVTKQRNGSHLKFPGKVPDHIIRLRRHQVNGIWRGIVDRFVLYDHAVGSGKTFTAIARAIERKRMGLSKKPMMVVPNHILEQVAKDVYTLYPGAKVLAAGTKDLSKANRRRLFARIATGDWDLVIVPHSSFQFIGISPDTEERYLQEELELAIQAVEEAEAEADAEGFNGRRKPLTVKEAERLRDNIEARLAKVKERAAKRDNLLTFEQMGIDDLTVDESHEFKNLFYHSKLNVRGMNPKAGSAKAYDLWSKVRVLREMKNGSVAFMTGTPVSNSAVELYGIMRYLAADTLEEMGLEHFDAWRSQFATVTTAFEPKESGRGLKEVNRIGRDWSNMRSLMDLYYSFADAVSNDDIKKWYKEDNDGAEFPIPKVKGGGRRSVNVEPSAVQESIIEQIVQGFDDLPNIEDVDERNAERLRLMDLARKVSLDARAVDPYIQDNGEGGKLAQVAVEVKRIYDAWHNDRGTQLIFLDRSVPKSKGDAATIAKYDSLVRQLEQAEESGDEAAAMKLSDQLEKYDHDEMASLKAAQQGGWNAYDEIKKRLIESGIPADEIRYVQEATTDDQKKMLFEEVNAGKVRILFGSTPRMGAGTNVQERLVGLHHVDVTWKPSDIEQREGRIIRQGNSLLKKYGDNFEVEILAYTTNRTVDAKLWSLNATKLKMINGLRHYTGDFNVEFDDSDSVGMAEIAAIASGEPLQLERVQLASEIDKLNRQKRAHQRRIFGMKDELDDHQRALKNEQTAGTFEQYAGIYAGIEEKAGRREVTITSGDETETFTFDQAAEAKSYITGFAEKAAESEEKFSINVGGKKYTSKSKAHDAVQAALGDGVPFEAELEGETYISRSALDKTITGKVKDAVDANLDPSDPQAEMDETPIGSVRFGDLEVNLSAQVVGGGRMGSGEQILEVFAEARIGETWLVNNNVLGKPGKDGKNISEVVRGLSGAIARSIKEFPAIVRRLKEKADKAREMIPKLESLVEEPFQKEQELEGKQRRLEEVERELSASADAAPETDNNPAMSRKTPQEQARLTKQQVLQTIGPIVQNWKNAPRIEAVQSVKDLPLHLKNYIFSADPFEGAGIDGVFDPKTGTIFLIADALPDAQRAQHVLLHEVVGHYGLRGLLGKDFKAILDQIGTVRRKDLRSVAMRWGYDLNTPEGRRGAAEEWLAEIAGRGETNGFIRRTIAAIRDTLRKLGFTLEYSDADLVQLVAKARKYVEQGEAGTGGSGIKFSRAASVASPARISALQAKADAMPDSVEKTSLMQKLQAMQGGTAAPSATATTQQRAAKPQTPTKTRDPGRLSEAVQPRLDYLRMKFQDKFIPLKRTQQALKKQGWNEREANNPYLAEELSHGIAKDRLDKFEDEQVQPLMDEIKAAPVSLEDLERYVYAKHAPERNAYIQKINPEFEEGGSGMTDQEAAEVIDQFRKDGKLKVLHDLAKKVWALGEMQRRIIREEGLEEHDRLDAWESFDFYVPLKGAPDGLDEGHGRNVGRGFAVVKSGTKSALGRHSEAENILAHLVAQVADTIVRAERAKVGKAFLQMVEENPDPKLWTVRTRDNLPTREVLAKNPAYTALQGKLKRRQDALQKATDGAEIERLQDEIADLRMEMDATPARQVAEVDDFEWIKADNVLPVTRDGKVHYIQIENQDLARVMKNLGAADQGKAIRALARLNRTLAMVNTSLNPEFVITNFERDFQTAMINLSGEQSAKLAAKVAKGIPAAMKGIRSTLRGSGTADMSQWYERFKAAGAQVGYLDLQSVEQTQKKIQKLVREQDGKLGTVWKYAQKVGTLIGDYNAVVENAVRLSAFKVAIENGMSEAKAASLAKNLTVNFNRKGELGPAMNALYLFFNAGVQGSARIITGLAKSKRTRKICAGITLAAFALAEMNRLQAGDDDDDENRWDKVSDYTKATNLLIMRGDESGDAWKIKLPYGYNLFVALGYTMSDVRAYLTSGGKHGKSPAQGAVSLIHAGMNAFNPLGGDDSLLQMVSPTIMDPFVQVSTNENFMGSPIMPDQPSFGPPKPKSELYWSSVRPLSKAIAQQINELTGGSSVEPGAVDISPEVLDHFWDFATGGSGRFYADSINAMAAMARGEELPVRRIPFARQVYQEKSDYYDRQHLHDNMDKVAAHYDLFKEMMVTGRKGDAMRYRQEHPEIALKRTADNLQQRLSKLRQGKEKLENVDKERYKDRIDRINKEIERLTMAFNRKYNQTVTR